MKVDCNDLASQFSNNGFEWKTDNQPATPSVEEIETFLAKTKEELDKSTEDDVFFIGGRFIVHKDNGHYDVYLYQGELE